jgi:sulfonate transport system permease protein
MSGIDFPASALDPVHSASAAAIRELGPNAAASAPPDAPATKPRSARGDLITIQPARPRRGLGLPRPLRRAIGPLLVLLGWYIASATGVLSANTLASPSEVVHQGWLLIKDGQLPSAIYASGKRVVIGFAVGGTIAVVLALLAGLFRLGEDLIDATVGMIRTIPWVGLIPLFIIWFGIDESPKIALVALGVAIPLYFNLYGGIRAVDAQLVEAGTTLGLNRWGLIRHIILPGALPGALVGLRYALGSAWLALVFGETINATDGIGYLMNNAEEFFQTDVIVVCLVAYAVLGLLCDLTVRVLSRYLLAWRSSFEGA